MIRRARTWLSATLDDPWRVLQVYLVLLAVFVLAAGLALSADPARPPAGDRPVVQGVSRSRYPLYDGPVTGRRAGRVG